MSVFLLVAFSVPFHFAPIGFFIEEATAAAAVVLGGALAWACMGNSRSVSAVLPLWCLWGVVLALSYINGDYSLNTAALWALVYWSIGCLVIVWFSRLHEVFGYRRAIEGIASLMVLALVIQAILGVAKFYGLLRFINIPEQASSRMPGLLNQANVTSCFVTVGLISVIFLSLRQRLGMAFQLVLAWMAGSVLFLTGTRAVWGYFFIIGIAALVVVLRGRDSFVGRKLIQSVCVACIGVVVAFFSQSSLDHGLTRIAPDDLRGGTIERADFTRSATELGLRPTEFAKVWHGAFEQPWFGVGINNYPYFSFRMDSEVTDPIRSGHLVTHSHNIFSMILAEQGLVGLVTFLVMALWLAFRIFRLEKNAEWFWVASILGVFFLFSNVEFPLWYLHYLVLFLGVLTFALPAVRFTINSRLVAVGCSAAVLITFLSLGASVAPGFYVFASAYLNPGWDQERVQQVHAWRSSSLIGPYGDLLVYKYLLPTEGGYQQQLNRVQRVIEWRPQGPALSTKIMLLALMDRDKEACRFAEKAVPFMPSIAKRVKADLARLEEQYDVELDPVERCLSDLSKAYDE
ncbi:Wzy polymerase domain-containing protein [Salicola sp. Rm-C-2C1-2]